MEYTIYTGDMPEDAGITIVGCGGTGGFVAEGICRLLGDRKTRLLLIDYDRVERHNLRRQAFYEEDLWKFKSQALAERLCRRYGREIMYSVYPFAPENMDGAFSMRHYARGLNGLIIGCVDNARARQSIQDGARGWHWWIDAGNGEHSGQVLIGNINDVHHLNGGFNPVDHTVSKLPMPTLQEPALLIPPTAPVEQDLDCAEAVDANLQSPVVNQTMASLVLQFVSRLLEGKLTWMGAYVDLDAGTLRPIPAEPETVARMVGVRVDQLTAKEKTGQAPYCPRCGSHHW